MILNIEKSMQLYKLIQPFVSDLESEDILELSSTIVSRIIEANEQEKFLHISMLLTGKKMEELISISMEEFIPLFLESLAENRIKDLVNFYKVGFNG